jgi:transcriptional regulator with XRE-family HTH domain
MHFLRVARLMTQAQLAEIVGVDRSTIARYESGKDVPPPELRLRIACVLGTMPECLWPPGEVLDRLLAS